MTPIDLRMSPRRRRREATRRWMFTAAAAMSVAISTLIVFSLVREAWVFAGGIDLGTLWGIGWFPRRGLFDLKTLLVGSLLVTAVAMLIALPLGVGAAVFLAEYAGRRVRRVLKPAIEILAGVPSVVLGFFALAWISPHLVQRLWSDARQFNLAAAGIGVGILTLPLIASIAEDALRAVPDELRNASFGLGATKKTTTLRVVIPAAISGLVAAFIVGVSRAIGETMVVAIAAGASGGAIFTLDVTEPGQTMTAAMASLAAGTDQVRGASFAFQSLFFVGLVLFVITLALNAAAERFVRRTRYRY